jgi:hypothetical protein
MNLKLIHVFFFYVSVLSVTFLISQISLIEQVEFLMGLYESEQVESCTSKFMNKHSSPSIISYFFCSSLDFFAGTKEQQRGKTTEILGGK